MISGRKYFIGFILVFAFWLWPPAAQGQSPKRVNLLQFAAAERGETVALDLLLTVSDGNGRAFAQPAVESATVQIAGNPPMEAQIEAVQTDAYIALLLDTSVTMEAHIAQVRETAKAALDNAPANAYIAVIQFDEQDRMLVNFTNDHNQVRGAIDQIKVIPYPITTCLYDAVFNTIGLLNRSMPNPQARRAVVLVTDGKDELHDRREACTRTHSDMMAVAVPAAAPGTPIYAVGYCRDVPCSNVDRSELHNLALDTAAVSAVVEPSALEEALRNMMDHLSFQWAARAEVAARQGRNDVTLSVKLRDDDQPLTATFSFNSTRNIPAAPLSESNPEPDPPTRLEIPRLELGSLSYDEARNLYSLSLGIANPQAVDRLFVTVEAEGGVLALEKIVTVNAQPTRQVDFEASTLAAGQRYIVTVSALDGQGRLIELQDNDDLVPVRKVKEFEHAPAPQAAVDYTVESVNANYETEQLMIDLDIESAEPELIYDGYIVDESGQRIFDLSRNLLNSTRLVEPLPVAMKQAVGAQKFQVAIYLSTRDGRRFGPQNYEFKVQPPAPPGLLYRIWTALNIPPVWITAVFILLCLSGWLLLKNRQHAELNFGQPGSGLRPPMD